MKQILKKSKLITIDVIFIVKAADNTFVQAPPL